MRILDRAAFLEMPSGTLFAKCRPWIFEQLSIKGSSMTDDFNYLDLATVASSDSGEMFDRLIEMRDMGASYPFDDTGYARDGFFDKDALFLVFERADLLALRGRIDEAIAVAGTAPVAHGEPT